MDAGAGPTPWPRLRPYQTEVLRAVLGSVRDGRGLSFSVMMSRQAGKNELSAQLEAYLLLRHHAWDVDAVKCAPTFRPQAQISLRRLWTRLRAAGLGRLARLEGGNSVRLGRARQLFLSAEPGSHVVGHTAHLLLECDEAQDVDPDKFDRDFRPMAAATGATIVFYGTAWREDDLLARVRAHHLELERRDGIRRHFAFDWETVARYHPPYARFVAQERDRLGESHPLFLTQYLLQPLPGTGRLFTPAQRALLRGDHPRLHAPPAQAPERLLGHVAGLDVGGEALAPDHPANATVLTIARVLAAPADAVAPEPSIEVVEHAAWHGASHAELAGGLVRLLRVVWRARRVVVDATGLGEGLAATLAAACRPRPGVPGGGPEVVRVRLTEERKSALGYALLAAVNGGRLRLYRPDGSPECTALWRELELARAEHRPGGRLAWRVDPSDGHDDFLMSLALTVEAARGLVPRVARGHVPTRHEC